MGLDLALSYDTMLPFSRTLKLRNDSFLDAFSSFVSFPNTPRRLSPPCS